MNEDELVFYLDLTGLFLGKPSRCKHNRRDDREKNQPTASSSGFHAPVVNPAAPIFKNKITVFGSQHGSLPVHFTVYRTIASRRNSLSLNLVRGGDVNPHRKLAIARTHSPGRQGDATRRHCSHCCCSAAPR